VPIGDGAGILATLDDSGGGNDSGPQGTLDVEIDGARVDRLLVHFTAGPPDGVAPVIADLGIVERPASISLVCPTSKTVFASVKDADGDASQVTAAISQAGVELARVELAPASPPLDPSMWTAPLPMPASLHAGSVVVTITAHDTKGHVSEPAEFVVSVADALPPEIVEVSVFPSPLPGNTRTPVTVSARVLDDCGVRRVTSRVQRGDRFRLFTKLNDHGKKDDATARDGVFTGRRRLHVPTATSLVVEIAAYDRQGQSGTQQVTVPIAP
jgi:hypothetical protein